VAGLHCRAGIDVTIQIDSLSTGDARRRSVRVSLAALSRPQFQDWRTVQGRISTDSGSG